MATSAPFFVVLKVFPMSLPITSITALFAGVLILALTIIVIRIRRRDGVVLGDNDNRVMAKAIRGQGNAVEQLPIALILMGLAELQGGNDALLWLCAGLLIIGRCLHGVYFAVHGTHWRFRMFGMLLTMIAQAGLIIALGVTLIS
jgi:uncharacterized membrane protein YecN with MAPEG domain